MFGSYNQLAAFDGRLTLTGGWTKAGSDTSLGGPMWNTGAAGRLSFAPPIPVDTFLYSYPTLAGGGLGTLNVKIDGGTNTPINQGLANGFVTAPAFTRTLGLHTLNLDWVSGVVYAARIIAYNSAIPSQIVYSGGWSSSNVSNWHNGAASYNPYPAMAALAANLNFVAHMINDAVAGTDIPGAYIPSLQSIGTNVQPTGSVIFMTENATDPAISGVSHGDTGGLC